MPATILAFAFFLVSLSISFNQGSFSGNITPIILLAFAFLILIISYFKPRWFTSSLKVKEVAPLLFMATFVLFTFFDGGWWASNHNLLNLIQILTPLSLVPAFILAVVSFKNKHASLILFIALIAIAFLLRLLMLAASPGPAIDVYTILNEAPKKLLTGINPYNTMYTYTFPGVTPDYYSYWPASILLEIPFVVIFHDPRMLFVLADILAGIMIFFIAGKTKTGMFLSLTYLFRPLSLFIIEGSWLTPLNFLLFTYIVYFLSRKNKGILTWIFLGLLTGVQFFHGVIALFMIKFLRFNKSNILAFFLMIFFISVPFIWWTGLEKFFLETVWFYFRTPPPPNIVIHDSINLNTLIFSIFKHDIPSVVSFGFMFIILCCMLIKQEKKISCLAGSTTLFFFSVYLFGRQGFVNYFYFIGSLLLLWLATLYRESEESV